MNVSRRNLNRGGITLVVSIAVVVLVLVILLFHFLSRREEPAVKDFQELVKRVEKINTQISDREQRIIDLVHKYNEVNPEGKIDTTGMASFGLSPEQAEALASRVASEKDLSYRGMLQEIIDLTDDIEGLTADLDEVKSRLHPPRVVKEGDTHLGVCLDFLTQEIGMSEEEALHTIEREAMTPELLPGFEIWNYYGDGIFGTFVTQGSASISPNELQRATKRRIDAERQALIQARNQKEREVQDLEARRIELQDQIRSLEESRETLMQQMAEIAAHNDSLAAQINSVSYTVATFRELLTMGAIRKPALGKWQTVDLHAPDNPVKLDLRSDNRISFSASDLELKRITKILVFPRYFEEDLDYRVIISEDRQLGTVIIERPDRFHLANVAIAVD